MNLVAAWVLLAATVAACKRYYDIERWALTSAPSGPAQQKAMSAARQAYTAAIGYDASVARLFDADDAACSAGGAL